MVDTYDCTVAFSLPVGCLIENEDDGCPQRAWVPAGIRRLHVSHILLTFPV